VPRDFNIWIALRSAVMMRFRSDLGMVFQEDLSCGSKEGRLGLRRSARDAHRFGGGGGGGDGADVDMIIIRAEK